MIQLSGSPFQQSDMWPSNGIESMIIRWMKEDPVVYSYSSIDELSFELELRKNILLSAVSMKRSSVQFAVFAKSRCNPRYWNLTDSGGFRLKEGVKPSEAIKDIYVNSSEYAFECAGAMVIIYYHAVLNVIGETSFNQLFPDIYIYSWHSDPDLGIHSTYIPNFLPGDVVYFENPDFDPTTPQWRGENAVVLGDGMFFGHGLGKRTAEQIITALNKRRNTGSNQSAYLSNLVTRPSFDDLMKFSMQSRESFVRKQPYIIIKHNETSISFNRYLSFLYAAYNQ
ncbi:protein-glutamine gamma-glutamyltransferase [Halobacillus amylolyticus]|uniref:Protein-glutamine gamma-glutamyltransferase n=1 Tax=Halobacillus amylolyticus TaxID=2932259 RepID=A0ABY4HBY9_9BACI|nr:protein-glutamine gamma-glutamyltransferase [Halobacillus amylolyticus]UOR11445.1 protein-glutamine gamma-glutamyltransferase [Halobacillus amylolyticus]